jgi:hypothetical protein
MRAYLPELTSVNLRELLPACARPWSLEDRLAIARDENQNHTTGAGSRRRSSYEHQVDRHLELLRACGAPDKLVKRSLHRSAGGGTVTLRPWELLRSNVEGHAPGLRDLRVKIERLIEWSYENHPREAGWMLSQSKGRAAREERATEYYLPRASWRAFTAWRRVQRELWALLLLLHTWFPLLIPPPRRRFEGEAREATARMPSSDSHTGTGCRDQAPSRAGSLLRLVLPHGAM